MFSVRFMCGGEAFSVDTTIAKHSVKLADAVGDHPDFDKVRVLDLNQRNEIGDPLVSYRPGDEMFDYPDGGDEQR